MGEMNDMNNLVAGAGMIVTLGTALLTVMKVNRTIKKDREEQEAKILQSAKEEDALVRTQLEAKIKAQEVEIANMKEIFAKDIDHLRETHSGQIANLGEKIEQLRDELRTQHGQMVDLLSKLIDNR